MPSPESYRDTLQRYQRELARIEGEAADLRVVIAGLQKLVQREAGSSSPAVTPSAPVPKLEHDPRMLTAKMEDAAIIALRRVGRPMRVREIFNAITTMGFPYARGFDVFKGSMIPTLRKSKRFTRPARGFYGLAEWKDRGGDHGLLNLLAGGTE